MGIADSALKRGIAYSDVAHVIATGDYLGPIRDGLIWWIGETKDQAIVAVHAMTIGWRMP